MSSDSNSNGKVIAAAIGGVVAGGLLALGLVHVVPSPKVCHAHHEKQEAVTTHYWNGRGLMETPRQMLHAAGREFVDGRHSEFTGDDKANLGRMPTIELESGRHVGQSKAINYYVARTSDLLGDDAFEAAKCLEIQEHVSECIQAFQKIVPYGTAPTEEQLKLWFEEGTNDTEGVAQNRQSRYLTWYLGRIEAGLTGTNGFAVGNRLSLGDFCLYSLLGEHLSESESEKSEYVDRLWPLDSFPWVSSASLLGRCSV